MDNQRKTVPNNNIQNFPLFSYNNYANNLNSSNTQFGNNFFHNRLRNNPNFDPSSYIRELNNNNDNNNNNNNYNNNNNNNNYNNNNGFNFEINNINNINNQGMNNMININNNLNLNTNNNNNNTNNINNNNNLNLNINNNIGMNNFNINKLPTGNSNNLKNNYNNNNDDFISSNTNNSNDRNFPYNNIQNINIVERNPFRQIQNDLSQHIQYQQEQNLENLSMNNLDIKKVHKGNYFTEEEANFILNNSYKCLKNRDDPLSQSIIKTIKDSMGGDWVVFVCANGLKGYDLSVSVDDENKLLVFIIDNFRFQIIKIKD